MFFHTTRCFMPFLLAFALLIGAPAHASQLSKAAANRTLESLKNLKTISSAEIASYTPKINALDYTSSRAIRALLQLPAISPADLPAIFSLPELFDISFSAIPLLEYYVGLPGATLSGARLLLTEIKDVSFVYEQVLAPLPNLKNTTADGAIRVIRRLKMIDTTDEAGQWATRALLSIETIDEDTVLKSVDLITPLTPAQKRAAEKCFATPKVRPAILPALLGQLSILAEIEAINLSGLLAGSKINGPEIGYWLNNYFTLPDTSRESAYPDFSIADKNILLTGLGEAAPAIAEQLNNLHAVTDNFGQEISGGRLAKMSPAGLQQLFHRLDPTTRNRFGSSMQQALAGGDRAKAIALLRLATQAARRQLARDLTCENLYVLLAHGSELFDSSFRDILVPEMVAKLSTEYNNNLLSFLGVIDPDSLMVSDFLTHLAWKGSLTTFFPQEAAAQQEVLKLLAKSALGNEKSLLFFAATFIDLLKTLQPQARTTLLELLLQATNDKSGRFARQVQVILQEYLDHHPQLLSAVDSQSISAMLDREGWVDIAPYVTTPFAEWLSDGKLCSLSVFQNDDDGSISYREHGSYLFRHGYRPAFSNEYEPGPIDKGLQTQLITVLQKLQHSNSGNLAALFQLAARTPVVIVWQKRIGKIDLNHFVYIYHGKTAQENLLKTFLTKGHELFAQRGHSYWRGEQLLLPLDRLIERKEITPDLLSGLPRFISIGSCGGIRAYGELISRFGNRLDILATVGTGTSTINTPYNTRMLEIVAEQHKLHQDLTWKKLAQLTNGIFAADTGDEYIRPGSLPAILYKMSAR
ncbi:hypothetical protein [Desulfopila aestuarii]|uniref:CHAT domain-containing protein n=1 Tax=Desulfopila aestuarii DSM 18488 TaxID=1121416 RepID=A0A1M7Y785_9BACT|nr:hypothetical protein [Desulfopila aestuarii]SHO48480.1 hypothetical protein SAMN02745220_02322 [Desulfopila aestuarii DSM 18488]